MHSALLVLRLLAEHTLLVQRCTEPEEQAVDAAEKVAGGERPSSKDWDMRIARWAAVQALQSHRQTFSVERPEQYTQLLALSDSMAGLISHSFSGHQRVTSAGILMRHAGIITPADLSGLTSYRVENSEHGGIKNIRELCCAVQVNSFAVQLPGQAQGVALAPGKCRPAHLPSKVAAVFPLVSNTMKVRGFAIDHTSEHHDTLLWTVIAMANHSCEPNCEVVVVRGGRPDEPELTLALRALRDLTAGEEATINYLSASPACTEMAAPSTGLDGDGTRTRADPGTQSTVPPVSQRRKRLWETKFFLCECSKCVAEATISLSTATRVAAAAAGDSVHSAANVAPSLLRPFSAAWYLLYSTQQVSLSCHSSFSQNIVFRDSSSEKVRVPSEQDVARLQRALV